MNELKRRRALVTAPFIPIVGRLGSHRSAAGVIYADQIRQTGKYDRVDINWGGEVVTDHNAYDSLYVYHGSDWGGTLNLFGGVQAFPYAWNIRNISKFRGEVFSLGIDFPEYHKFIAERIKRAQEKSSKIQDEWGEVDLENLSRMCREATTLHYPHVTRNVVIGDSHAICMHRPGWTVNSVPFKTLNGVLNLGLHKFIEDFTSIGHVDSAEFYFGNIDVRHHLCRLEGDPLTHARALALRYVGAVSALEIKRKAIYELLPIENESRSIPQTGYYDKRPFHGSWERRNEVRVAFNDLVEKLCTGADGMRFIRWTDYLLNAKGELDFKFMEKPHSIHLSREFYPHWQGGVDFPIPVKAKGRHKSSPATSTQSLTEFFS